MEAEEKGLEDNFNDSSGLPRPFPSARFLCPTFPTAYPNPRKKLNINKRDLGKQYFDRTRSMNSLAA
jgi:hypothetical protein